MEKQKGNKIKLGIFVSIGLTLFIVAIYLIGEKQQLFSKTFLISGIFKDISGLQVGNNVRFSGINVGIVDNIEMIADTAVRVDMVIDEDTRKFMKKDAKAIIGSDGLMGNKIITITPGTLGSEEIQHNATIATILPISIDDIMLNLKITSNNAADITDDLAVIMYNVRMGRGTIGKFLMDSAFAESIDQTLSNIRQGAGGFKQNMDAASHSVLLRGFLKKKDKEAAKKKAEIIKSEKEKKKQ